MPADDASISIPQVAVCVIIGYFVLRWFLKSPDANPSSASSRPTAAAPARRTVDRRRLAQQVDVIKGMFPQFSDAAIEAELLRNGMSIEVATDRILSTGFLPEPPRPAAPPASVQTVSSSSRAPTPAGASGPRQRTQNQPAAAAGASSSKLSSQYPDLITRYNLHSRLNEEPSPEVPSFVGKGKAPASKADRQMAHKAKRDEMVLEARRTVEKMIKEGRHPV